MGATTKRRAGGAGLLLLGLTLAAAGAYHLYCRFVSDEAWWDRSVASGRDIAALEESQAEARGRMALLEGLVSDRREAAEGLRRAGKGERAEKAEESVRTFEAKLQQVRQRMGENEKRLAGARAALEERRGRWLRRGLLLAAVGLALSAQGGLRAFRKTGGRAGPAGPAGQ